MKAAVAYAADVFNALLVLSGVFWTVTYLLIIRQGSRDRVCGMPLVALCANLSWEFLFSFPYPHHVPQVWVNRVWLAFDLVILAQLLMYWRNDWPTMRPMCFAATLAVSAAVAMGAVWGVSIGIDDPAGAYAAFGQNLLMSVLFIHMLRRRGSLAGQSLTIAWCKLIGTVFASAAFWIYISGPRGHILLPTLYVAILVVDVYYVRLVRQALCDGGRRTLDLAEPQQPAAATIEAA